MAHFVYILECADGTLYTGYTKDLEKRLAKHNGTKSGARYTRGRRPVALRYSEKFRTVGKALRREAEIKGFSREGKLALISSFGV